MKKLRITGVPEHFNFPWKNVVARQPFLENGIELIWIDESRGSGQMNKALRENETDLAIVLTESFLQDFEAGNPSKLIGFHVLSPLIWGIHISGKSKVTNLHDLHSYDFLISRPGSGSNLMGYVLAQREGWPENQLNFKIVSNLQGALKEMENGKAEMFLWEKYTTKPYVDSGDMKRIGEIPSPWPCFGIIATSKAIQEYATLIYDLRDLVYQESKRLQSSPETTKSIAENYQLEQEDVESWLGQTKWATNSEINLEVLKNSINRMLELGILKKNLNPQDFLSLGGL
ncbi:ABC transporter substrate-binding protein [Algoriphagus sp. CAU 1675]|uniref:ABC transporter substrate-binding protein n=1 Tax=Algoriphagus sp. CAU 1675 TaxID=3032597 RepID=UPI0023D97C5D|nr:ABC transporter substrate-binding protein [Algoriphagus sp. CAU 1675]MDF2158105.1 ABC transporter substrate-binding protein [Algoriphagus sp. CAU 1675]